MLHRTSRRWQYLNSTTPLGHSLSGFARCASKSIGSMRSESRSTMSPSIVVSPLLLPTSCRSSRTFTEKSQSRMGHSVTFKLFHFLWHWFGIENVSDSVLIFGFCHILGWNHLSCFPPTVEDIFSQCLLISCQAAQTVKSEEQEPGKDNYYCGDLDPASDFSCLGHFWISSHYWGGPKERISLLCSHGTQWHSRNCGSQRCAISTNWLFGQQTTFNLMGLVSLCGVEA